ncbi:hypothetical protein AB0J38_41315 [Streptomyces sp. NPDC050095]|uniref:hypothetical protein n=1 Tax=unclassified Streptomyces TaxID=2593676 RepID=UPI00343E708F
MAAIRLTPGEIYIIGWDNGGVSVVCKHCLEELGAGGCDCCGDNNVTMEYLLAAAEVLHECKGEQDSEDCD